MQEISYQYPRFERLQPRSEWRGGRLADTDLLTLEEAAGFASKHAGEEITARDFLRAAGRGEITLRAIVYRAAKVRKHDGGVLFNKGEPNENIVPAGAIPTLPLSACQHLANAGRARWRTFDGFEERNGILMRYTKGMLHDDEPDFETVPDDCRVVGYDVHALADEYCAPEDAPQAAAPERTDFAMLATREQLIEAFGPFTGMDANWFANLRDTPALRDARRITGQGGRNAAAPYFCPFAVMKWLVDGKRKKGRPLSERKGWELLEKHFPRVYASRSIGDPREAD